MTSHEDRGQESRQQEGAGDRAPGRGLRLPVQGAPDPRRGAGVPRRPARRHAQDQDPRRGLGLGQEAVEAEGHRPRPHGRHPQPAVAPGRHRPRPAAARLREGPVGAREEERPQVGAVAQARGASDRGGREPRARRATRPPSWRACLDGLGVDGKALLVDSSRQPEPGARGAQQPGAQDGRRARRSTSTTSSTGPILVVSERRLERLVEVLAQ